MLSARSIPGPVFLRGARQLLTLRGPIPRRGLACSQLEIIRDGSLLIEGGRIVEAGPTRRIENLRRARQARLIDVKGKVVSPGLIDSHMGVAGAPPELRAFEQRIAGLDPSQTAPDEKPAASRRGAKAESVDRFRRWLRLTCAGGTTTAEVCSGGERTALKELRELRKLAGLHAEPVEVIVAFSARAPSPGQPPPDAREDLPERDVAEVLRRAARDPRAAAVFRLDCGSDPPDAEASQAMLAAALDHGYRVKILALGRSVRAGVELAVQAAATAAEGLDGISESDIDRLAASSVVATLSPNLAYHRGSGPFPSARRMLDRGAAVSLASGFRSDIAPGFGLQTAMALACREMKLMPEEAIVCCTANAAAAVGRGAEVGSLEPGKQADLAVFDVEDYREIPYYFGVNLCTLTMRRGRIAYLAAGQSSDLLR